MGSRFIVLGLALLALGCSNGNGPTCPEALCNGVCCADGGQCITNACCPAARVCDSACCASGQTCIAGTTGTHSCGILCLKSADCPAAAPCCASLGGTAQGACTNGTSACLCLSSGECSAGQCAPQVNSAGLITGPYICVADDGSAHGGCASAGSCHVSTQECSHDQSGNRFCSVSCANDVNCGNSGVACCNGICSAGHCCGLCGR